jgi:hypothetical protein
MFEVAGCALGHSFEMFPVGTAAAISTNREPKVHVDLRDELGRDRAIGRRSPAPALRRIRSLKQVDRIHVECLRDLGDPVERRRGAAIEHLPEVRARDACAIRQMRDRDPTLLCQLTDFRYHPAL